MKQIFLLIAIGVITIFTSCSNTVDFGEQYKKEVYIVNSKELIYNATHEASVDSKGRISVYITGSELPKNDVYVSYKIDEDALMKYNKREYGDKTALYFSLIPENLYSFQESQIVIKAGNPYGCLNFTMNTEALISDKTYILPITILSAEGADVSESMHTMLYVIQVKNEYAGDYNSECKMDGKLKGEIRKVVTALSLRKVLLPLANITNAASTNPPINNKTDFYQITINEDHSLTLNPYLESYILQNPNKKSYYDPNERIFYIYYTIKDKYDAPVVVEEVLKLI